MNNAFFLGLHSLFLSLKQRHQIIFNLYLFWKRYPWRWW
jgi:hypothetical protein